MTAVNFALVLVGGGVAGVAIGFLALNVVHAIRG